MLEIKTCEPVSIKNSDGLEGNRGSDIVVYKSFEDKMSTQVHQELQPPVDKNPFGKALRKDPNIGINPLTGGLVTPSSTYRKELMIKFSHAIPSYSLLCYLSEFDEIFEAGAGNGYWAFLLEQMGVDVTAVDDSPGEFRSSERIGYHPPLVDEASRDLFTDVEKGSASDYDNIGEKALFLRWPPKNNQMAALALKHYFQCGGETVLYLGEGPDGMHAELSFFGHLLEKYKYVREVHNVSWHGCTDELHVYTKSGEDPVDECEFPHWSERVVNDFCGDSFVASNGINFPPI